MKHVRLLALALFTLGTLLGTSLAGIVSWGDLESSLFDTAISGEAPLRGLRCPVFINAKETGTVSASLVNRLDRPSSFTIRARITDGSVLLKREETIRLPLDPGERGVAEWTVTAQDAAYGGRLILVRVYQFAKYPLPSRDASCGIWVVRAGPLTGTALLLLLLAGSLGLLGSGLWLWHRAGQPGGGTLQTATYVMSVLTGLVGLALISGLMGWWAVGMVFVGVVGLTIVAVMAHFATRIA